MGLKGFAGSWNHPEGLANYRSDNNYWDANKAAAIWERLSGVYVIRRH